jgi:hypothetical protein
MPIAQSIEDSLPPLKLDFDLTELQINPAGSLSQPLPSKFQRGSSKNRRNSGIPLWIWGLAAGGLFLLLLLIVWLATH